MRTHPIRQPVMDGSNLQIDRFYTAKGPLHEGEGFVAAHCRRVVEALYRQAGAHDIDAVGCRLDGDLGGLAGAAEGSVGDVDVEMLAHPMLVNHRANRERDLGGTTEWIALAGDRC